METLHKSLGRLRHITEQNRDHIFAISCSNNDETARDALRSHLLQLARAAETECLLKWIMFFDNLFIQRSKPTSSSTSNNPPQLQIMRLDEARKIAKRCGLTDEEDMIRALEFFHKQGLALYFNEETLKDTMKRIWDGQKYTEETQKYLRSLMVKFGLAVEESESDMIIPCLVSKTFDYECQSSKKWKYQVESIAPPLGFSSMVIVGLLRLASAQTPPVFEVFQDGCVISLHRLTLAVKTHSSTRVVYEYAYITRKAEWNGSCDDRSDTSDTNSAAIVEYSGKTQWRDTRKFGRRVL